MPALQTKEQEMIIIFEGPDNSGKTTIAKATAEKLHIPYFKYSVINKKNFLLGSPDAILESSYYSLQLLAHAKTDIIIDRHYPSEYVYGQVVRKKRNLKMLKEIDKKMAEIKGHLIVICYKNKDNFKEDDFVHKKYYKALKNEYVKFANKFTIANTLLLETSDEDLNSQLAKITNAVIKAAKV